MNYFIKINYRTGDSFHSEDCTDLLDLSWQNEEIANENLERIKEHYLMIQELEHKKESNVIKKYKDKDWFVSNDNEIRGLYKYSLYLLLDNGEKKQYSTSMWVGYFETLYDVEVVCKGNSFHF